MEINKELIIGGKNTTLWNISGIRLDDINANNLRKAGVYYLGTGCSNIPVNSWFMMAVFTAGSGNGDVAQFGISMGSKMFFRRYDGNSWSSWAEVMKYNDFITTGTWTPIYMNCTCESYVSMTARWIKIGPLVIATLHDRPYIYNLTGNKAAQIAGLPFPVEWPQVSGFVGVFMPIDTVVTPSIEVAKGIGGDGSSGFEFLNPSARGANDCHWRETSSSHGDWLTATVIYWTAS